MEPQVTLEQLEYLLALGHESEQLDYKRSCDLTSKRGVVELAKDVAAMQLAGGYIVVGADDQGVLVPPGLLPDQHRMFDEANLRPKLARWLPEPFELRTAVHTIDACTLAVIYVVAREDGFCIFSSDGKYPVGDDAKIVFRIGEVFARHGTVNERWRQADIDQIRKSLVAREKERWRAECGRNSSSSASPVTPSSSSLVQQPTSRGGSTRRRSIRRRSSCSGATTTFPPAPPQRGSSRGVAADRIG